MKFISQLGYWELETLFRALFIAKFSPSCRRDDRYWSLGFNSLLDDLLSALRASRESCSRWGRGWEQFLVTDARSYWAQAVRERVEVEGDCSSRSYSRKKEWTARYLAPFRMAEQGLGESQVPGGGWHGQAMPNMGEAEQLAIILDSVLVAKFEDWEMHSSDFAWSPHVASVARRAKQQLISCSSAEGPAGTMAVHQFSSVPPAETIDAMLVRIREDCRLTGGRDMRIAMLRDMAAPFELDAASLQRLLSAPS